jgi:hypothetical protein
VIQDFISDNLHHLKRLRRSYRVDKHVAMNPNEVLRIENTVFILLGHASASASALNQPQTQSVPVLILGGRGEISLT